MIFIGALNVGQMIFNFEPKVETNTNSEEIKIYTYEDLHINKADEIGYFKMGSTIVMIWEKDFVTLSKQNDDTIKYGENGFENVNNNYNWKNEEKKLFTFCDKIINSK